MKQLKILRERGREIERKKEKRPRKVRRWKKQNNETKKYKNKQQQN